MTTAISVLSLIPIIIAAALLLGYILRKCKQMDAEDALWWQTPDEVYEDPCDTCHYWYECKGVDKDNCPKWEGRCSV